MRIRIIRALRAALIPLLAVVTSAGAQEPAYDDDPDEERSYSWGLGLAGMAMQQPYAGIGREYLPIPVIYFENRWLQLIGPTLELKLPGVSKGDEDALSFGVRLEYDGSGYKQSEAPILNGMEERKSGLLAGFAASWEGGPLSVSAEALFDASSHSKGRRVSLGLERTFHVGEHLMITPGVTGILLDKQYANYYFGVRPAEARAEREAYAPGSTWNTSFGVRMDYTWGGHHVLFLQAEYTALGNEIRNSPLIERAGESMLDMGYMFRF